LLRAPDSASRNPSNHGKETPDDDFESFHVAQQVKKDTSAAVHADDMEVFLVAHVSGSLARQVLRGVSCDAHA
jgi:mannose-6-phosphate isomerase-like protein (cupin superfamily)